MFHRTEVGSSESAFTLKPYLGVFRYSSRAIGLVWQTSPKLTLCLVFCTVFSGAIPAVTAYIGKLIVDAVVLAADTGNSLDLQHVFGLVAIEAVLVALLAAIHSGQSVCQSLLRALLGQRVNMMILRKALQLDFVHFEDPEFYDRLTQARREASSRPLSLVNRTFTLIQNLISLLSFGGLLLAFSPWAVLILAVAGLPAFIAETKFSGEAFRLFKWRSPETRKRAYLEMIMAREDFAKEVKLFELGPLLLGRYESIFNELYKEDRSLTMRRGFWSFVLGLVGTLAFYGAYGWIVWATVVGQITLGAMTMYLLLFRQGQSAFSAGLTAIGGMYEDNLYLSNLYSFLEERMPEPTEGATQGSDPGDGVRFENVWFTYPGADTPAVRGVSFHLLPGQKLALVGENGSGKTTLIKLLTRLYLPQKGRILLDGLDLRAWDQHVLRRRIGVIFQDFMRYQMSIGENVGAGDVEAFDNAQRWERASKKGLAWPFIRKMPDKFGTQLGRWFHNGVELSGGQWQKIALSRAFMRQSADILVLDEPTAAMDAEAELQVFDRFRKVTQDQMAILISHRFSTVRMADRILVLSQGEVVEQGSHDELMAINGRYAQLFNMQAEAYR